MNPARWKREHQLALGLAAVMGAALGILTVYLSEKTSSGFEFWLSVRAGPATLWWAVVGALLGSGVVYVRQLLRQ